MEKEKVRNIEDCFIGFNTDTCATIILHIWKKTKDEYVNDTSVKNEVYSNNMIFVIFALISGS